MGGRFRPVLLLVVAACAVAIVLGPSTAVARAAGQYEGRVDSIDSIDLRVANADLVVRGRIVEVRDTSRPFMLADYTWRFTTVAVAETLKGPPIALLTYAERSPGLRQQPRPDPSDTGPGALFFLIDGGGLGVPFGGKWPADWGVGWDANPVLPLDHADPEHRPLAVTVDFEVISDPAQILATVRTICAAPPPPVPGDTCVWLPDATAKELGWSPPPWGLNVPNTARAERAARAWAMSDDWRLRRSAVAFFGGSIYSATPNTAFRSAENIRALRGLLDDPAAVDGGDGPTHSRYFFLRDEAAGVLNQWEAAPCWPVIEEPLASYRPPRAADALLPAAAVVLAFVVLATLRRRHQHPGPPGRRLRLAGPGTAALVLAAVVGGGLWARSAKRTDELVVERQGRHRLASYRGGLQYTHVDRWAGPPRVVFGSFPPGPEDEDVWGIRSDVSEFWDHLRTVAASRRSFADVGIVPWRPTRDRSPKWSWARAGVAAVRGQTSDPTNAPQSYTTVRVAYPVLVAAALLPPAAAAAFRLARRRRRVRRGRCPACGYDLRASPGRCPECGRTEVTPSPPGHRSTRRDGPDSSPEPRARPAGGGTARYIFLAIGLVASVATSARAQSTVPPSPVCLEWQVARADLVVRGTVVGTESVERRVELSPYTGIGPDPRDAGFDPTTGRLRSAKPPWLVVTVRVDEALTAVAAGDLRFVCDGGTSGIAPASRVGDAWLLFLRRVEPSAQYYDPWGRSSSALVEFYPDVDWRCACGLPLIPDGAAPPHPAAAGPLAVDVDLRSLSRADEILSVAREAAAARLVGGPTPAVPAPVPTSQIGFVMAYLSRDTSQGISLSAYRARDLNPDLPDGFARTVPADDRTEAHARRWAASPSVTLRYNAVQVLSRRRSPENVAALRALLADPTAVEVGAGQTRARCYFLRRDAYLALAGWGEDVAPPVVEEPARDYRPAGGLFLAAPLAAATAGAVVASRRARRRRKSAGRRGRIRPVLDCARGALAGVAIAAWVAVVVLWVRTDDFADEWLATAFGARHRLASDGGNLRYTLVHDWPGPPAFVRATFDRRIPNTCWNPEATAGPAAVDAGPWPAAERLDPEHYAGPVSHLAALASVRGRARAPTGEFRPYFAFRVPHGYLAVPPVALLAAWGGLRLARIARGRKWARAGRCPACGYDVRGTPDRCPECGWATRPTAARLAAVTPDDREARSKRPSRPASGLGPCLVLAAGVAAALASTARAQSVARRPPACLEMEVAEADGVVRGSIVGQPRAVGTALVQPGSDRAIDLRFAGTIAGLVPRPIYVATVRVKETLKGTPRGEIAVVFDGGPIGVRMPTDPADEWLLCLQSPAASRPPALPPVPVGPPDAWECFYGLPLLPPDAPAAKRRPDLAPLAVDVDLRSLNADADVLRVAREAAVQPSTAPPGRPLDWRIFVPPYRPRSVNADLPADFAFTVPLDARTEAHARRWAASDSATLRYNAVLVLSQRWAPENAAALRGLLADPVAVDVGAGPARARCYFVRRDAYQALHAWGEVVDPPVQEEGLVEYRPVGGLAAAALLATAAAGAVLWAAVAWWRSIRRRRERAGGRGGPVRFALAVLVRSAAGATAGVAAAGWVGVLILWSRGGENVDEVVLVAAGRRHRLASDGGDLRYTFARHWPGPPSCKGVSFPRQVPGIAWNPEATMLPGVVLAVPYPAVLDVERYADRVTPVAGMAFVGGRARDPTGQLRPFVAVRVPHAYLAALPVVAAAGAAALRLALRLARTARGRQRGRDGRCPACGYDLRASPGKCPECGQSARPSRVGGDEAAPATDHRAPRRGGLSTTDRAGRVAGMAVAVMVLCASRAGAGPPPKPPPACLEWEVAQAPVVVRGTIGRDAQVTGSVVRHMSGGHILPFSGPVPGYATLPVFVATVRVRERIQGDPPPIIRVQFAGTPLGIQLPADPADEWLLCLSDVGPRPPPTTSPPATSPAADPAPRWQCEYGIPLVLGGAAAPERLSDLAPLAVDIDLRSLNGATEILATARQAAAAGPYTGNVLGFPIRAYRPRSVNPDLPDDFSYTVPPDERTLAHARRWAVSGSATLRYNAFLLLSGGRSSETVPWLRSLLSDPATVEVGAGPSRARFFFLRRYAYHALRGRGLGVDPPVFEEPAIEYRPAGGSIALVPIAAAAVAGATIGWRRRRGARRPGKVRRLAAAAGRAAAGVAVFGWVGAAVLWVRSARRLDEWVATCGARHRLSSEAGVLRYTLVRGWRGPPAFARGSFPRQSPSAAWDPETTTLPTFVTTQVPTFGSDPPRSEQLDAEHYAGDISARAGLAWVGGQARDPTGQLRPYWAVRIPHAYVVLLPALPVARVWAVRLSRAVRRRRRGRRGKCPACGYDLRGSPGRCPECGGEGPSAASSLTAPGSRGRRAVALLTALAAAGAVAAPAAAGEAGRGAAGPPSADLEWHVAASDLVVRGRVERVDSRIRQDPSPDKGYPAAVWGVIYTANGANTAYTAAPVGTLNLLDAIPSRPAAPQRMRVVTARVREVLKGPGAGTVEFIAGGAGWDCAAGGIDAGTDALICLSACPDLSAKFPEPPPPFEWPSETFAIRPRPHPITTSGGAMHYWGIGPASFPAPPRLSWVEPPKPAVRWACRFAVALGSRPSPPVVSMDLQPLPDAATIMDLAGEAARAPRQANPKPLTVTAFDPDGAVAGADAGVPAGTVYLVPLEPRTLDHARRWAESPSAGARCRALQVLAESPGPGDAPLVARLLREGAADSVFVETGAGPTRARYFPLRRRAYEALARAGVDVGGPPVEQTLTAYHGFGWREAAVTCLLAAFPLRAGVRRARGRWVWGGRWPRARAVLAGAAAAGRTFVPVGCVALVVLAVRSLVATDETVLTAGLRHRLLSQKGTVQYTLIPGWPEPPGWAFGSFPARGRWPDELPAAEAWDPEYGVGRRTVPPAAAELSVERRPRTVFTKPGLLAASGLAGGPTGRLHKYYAVRLSYLYFTPVAAVVAFKASARWRRAARRARRGCCPACGYDLRATPDRCPECGRPVPAAADGPSILLG